MAVWALRRERASRQLSRRKITRSAVDAARRKFAPEFMNRIDKVRRLQDAAFRAPPADPRNRIGDGQQRVLMAAGAHQFVFNCTPQVKNFLLAEGTDPKYGARHLKRAIERHSGVSAGQPVATGQVKLGDFIRVDMVGESKLTFVKEAEARWCPSARALRKQQRPCRRSGGESRRRQSSNARSLAPDRSTRISKSSCW